MAAQEPTKSVVGADAAQIKQVTGEALYLQRILLPPDTRLRVALVDVSRQDAPGEVLSEQEMVIGGRIPVPFALPYDPARIEPTHTYVVQARIFVEGRLRFITTEAYHVLTRGAPTHVQVILRMTGGADNSADKGDETTA